MNERPIVVLKFGSSVLCNEDCLPEAVSEIYRWYRDGCVVIAVVSAIGETTDALFAQASRLSPGAAPHHVASLVATGELTSAALLGLALDRAGVPAEVLDHHQLGVRACGDALDEDPVSLNADGLRARLADVPVLVVPGFLAVDEHGCTVLLGRGGSDLTAVFIAEQLQAARCRLIKDVAGVFDRDPNRSDGAARKFETITFDDAAKLSAAILQPKATAFAARKSFSFEVAALQSDEPSVVGAAESRFASHAHAKRRIRVALLGLGSVGTGVAMRLLGAPDRFEITRVLVRSIDRARDVDIDPDLLTNDPAGVLTGEVDIVIDALSDAAISRRLIGRALAQGIDVVSACKAVIAPEYDELCRAAERSGALLWFSSAVGGALPVLERIRALADQRRIQSIRGVLNGTTNFVLEAIVSGDDLNHAVARARRAGICEGDAADDLNGLDAARKLSIIAQHGLGARLCPHTFQQFGEVEPEQIRSDAITGSVTRQVATIMLDHDGIIAESHVGLCSLSCDDPLAATTGAGNVVVIRSADGAVECITGKGAGRWPTTESIWSDLCEVVRLRKTTLRTRIDVDRRRPAEVSS